MDFFKPIFPHDLDPSLTDSPTDNPLESNVDPNLAPWSFGGLIRTLTTRSESIIQTYRRDLQEFGSELQKEFQVSLCTIDDLGTSVLKETAQIIAQGKVLTGQDDPDSPSDRDSAQQSSNAKAYSRFDAQVRVLQGDINTYCEEPEDLEDYRCWREGFVLDAQREEIEGLLQENGDLKSVFDKVVPDSVDDVTFWCRYFYKVFKMKKAQDLRANIVKRAISREDVEQELSWDIDDDDDDDKDDRNLISSASLNSEERVDSKRSQLKEITEDKHEFGSEAKRNDESTGESVAIKKVASEESGQNDVEGSVFSSNQKLVLELRPEIEESNRSNSNGKESDFSVVSSHPSLQEEDLDWDEIEGLSTIDDKRMDDGGRLSTTKADMQKGLSTPEEEEDLSWDIDDDDESLTQDNSFISN